MGDKLAAELAALEAWERLRAVTPADKAAADAVAWRAWLDAYRRRAAVDLRAWCTSARAESGGPAAGSDGAPTPAEASAFLAARAAVMRAANPKYVLRNWIAQAAIAAAEAGDFSVTQAVLERMQDPYGERDAAGGAAACGSIDYTALCAPPGTAVRVSCSS